MSTKIAHPKTINRRPFAAKYEELGAALDSLQASLDSARHLYQQINDELPEHDDLPVSWGRIWVGLDMLRQALTGPDAASLVKELAAFASGKRDEVLHLDSLLTLDSPRAS